ncbi:MAG: DNA internalization-related competence protein ComEC/Rec2 [Deltaproteobacteria bacterium]|nr:DNA internalization-related competence protein ComEC/Rec2 [Deltaproteobacteria bacterium]MBW2085178.1 DNA internalization-related competence protein ComEC/Rec2 [Deltaproteobacteria bacterium]
MIKGWLRPLLLRPLLFLLLFFLAGLSWGPRLVPLPFWLWPLAALATLFFILWVLKRYRFPLAVAAMAFVLISLAAAATVFTPPEDAGHVYQYQDQPGLVFGGWVAEAPRRTYSRTRLVISAREVLVPGGHSAPVSGRIYLTVSSEHLIVKRGDWVRFPAVLRKISGFSNPGGFDYQAFWAARGIWVQGFLKDPRLLIVIKAPDCIPSPILLLDRFRNNSARFLDQAMAQPARGLVKTMLLGIRDDIEPEVKEAFRRLGLAHLLAISGLHIGLIAAASYWLFLKLLLLWPGLALRLNLLGLSILLSLGPVILYTGLAGGRPSTVRAAIMVGVFCLAFLLSKRRDLLTALAAAAWAILIFQPGAVFSVSFQLSFAAVGAIIIIAPRLTDFSQARVDPTAGDAVRRPLLGRVRAMASITIAAFLGTAPIVAHHFNQLPLLTLPANLILTPLIVLIIIPPGLFGLVLAPIFPWAAKIIFLGIERMLWILLATIEGAASWPWVNLTVPSPGPVFIIGYYLLLISLFLIRPIKKAALVSILIMAACIPILLWPDISRSINPQLTVTMLDVGQGNAAHVSFPDGTEMMIDGGGFPGSSFDPGENIIAPYLLHQGVTRLNILVLSHAQADHFWGLTYLAQNFKPTKFWSNHEPGASDLYQELINVINSRGLKQPTLADLYRPRHFGAARVQALHPPPDFLKLQAMGKRQPHLNNNSLTIRIQFGQIAFLFPGDLEMEGEAEILSRQGDKLRADVLLACHHGGQTSLTPAFLKAVKPRHVVFSVGRYNRFSQPAPEALARVRKIGARVFRTDRQGAVIFVTDGKTLKVKTWK